MFFFARADTAAPTVESAVKCQARRVRMPSPVATSIGDQCAKDAPSNIAGGGDGPACPSRRRESLLPALSEGNFDWVAASATARVVCRC